MRDYLTYLFPTLPGLFLCFIIFWALAGLPMILFGIRFQLHGEPEWGALLMVLGMIGLFGTELQIRLLSMVEEWDCKRKMSAKPEI